MPYILVKRRDDIVNAGDLPGNAGELNYKLTRICLEYLHTHSLKYSTINDIVGALEGAKLEFYRRVASPYEDKKIKENGDVY